MRLKNLLTFLVLLSVSLGMRAAGSISTENGVCTITLDNPSDLDDLDYTNHLAATKVVISCNSTTSFTSEDVAKINQFTSATTLDMSGCKSAVSVSDLNMPNLEYLRLPDGMTSAEDVAAMANLKTETKNTKLKVVGAFDGSDTTLPELALYSFQENELSNFSSQMMNLADVAMVARLAGNYGDKDLNNGGNPVFGHTPPCIWDFTGATFSSCTSNVTNTEKAYHAYNDPFCYEATFQPGDNYQTNAFFYFSLYSTKVVDIKLPTGITTLPPLCLNRLGSQNIENDRHKAAFKAYYNATDEDLTGKYKITNNTTGALIPTLTIPDNYTKLDYECGKQAYMQHLVIGGGMKIVEGGAFYNCTELEDLDFGAGLSDCYLGEDAFRGQNNSVMKHIALSEGIVSLGASCFMNAQQMESIRLPQSLINIGNNAFDNCLALNSITIPENVDKIGMDAFKLCPFTDIYLTTTDPNKIPMIFTGGNNFHSWGVGASFHHGHYDGWEGMDGIHAGNDPDGWKWDDAVDWYFINCNGLPVLHYPKQLREKVRADISAGYHGHSSDTPSLGLPTAADMHARETAGGANVGTSGQGIYTRDGWAQFMLMKEFTTDPGSDLYQKEYDDVWYTMCFPFDLSDEQLAGAFNETFNIVDFSGVEVVEANEEADTPLTLILHFNNVAMTDYKDSDGKHYKRKLDENGKVIREKDQTSKFEYNVYTDGTYEYHHVNTSSQLSTNKTKTFAKGSSMENAQTNFNSTKEAFIIDGILATAGHPYMIHPAIGVNDGGTTKKKCSFSGVEWAEQSKWAKLFTDNSRTIDLGIKKTLEELPDSNYNHAGYSKYAGKNQKYTFIGNSKEYRDGAQAAIGNEPQVPDEPKEPVAPIDPDGPESPFSAEDKQKPAQTIDAPTPLTADEQVLVTLLTEGKNQHERGPWYGITENITASWNDSSDPLVSNYKNKFYIYGSTLTDINSDYGTNNNANEAGFNYCKDVFNRALQYDINYAKYLANKALWDRYNAYVAAVNTYNNWTNGGETSAWNEYRSLKTTYNNAVTAHNEWLENAKKWKTYIPKNAYFLGRKTNEFPKYYRETAANPAEGQASTRQGGAWPQFTAIIIPNAAAVNGIEKELDGAIGNNTKGLNMVFNEDFEGEFDPSEIKEIVAEAEEKGEKVQYMNIVYSINGEIVGQGSHSLSNLPQGMYIINGKKYLVK